MMYGALALLVAAFVAGGCFGAALAWFHAAKDLRALRERYERAVFDAGTL